MRKICVFTGTRAEYGLLRPLIREIEKDPDLELQLVVSGMHLSPEFDLTYREIEADGFRILERVEMLMSSDSPVGICKSMGLGLMSYPEVLDRLRPDILVVLGDRFEVLSMTLAAVVSLVPVAHLHGGEATRGLIDEPIRHAVTKMSHLHFTSTAEYRRRVIQLGEDPRRVFHVGAIGIENIKKMDLLSRREIEEALDLDLSGPFLLVTYHPVTLERDTGGRRFRNLLDALDALPDLKVIITKTNADTHGRVINRMIDEYVGERNGRAVAFASLGQLRYLSLMKEAAAVGGNSSSGIIEAPSFGVPTVNIGTRQGGRTRAASVIDCEPEKEAILNAIRRALSSTFRSRLRGMVNPYERPGTALSIRDVLKSYDLKGIIKKEFYDLEGKGLDAHG